MYWLYWRLAVETPVGLVQRNQAGQTLLGPVPGPVQELRLGGQLGLLLAQQQ